MFNPSCAKPIRVEHSHSEESIWRGALGNREPLLVFATYGAIDAPDYMPSGSMESGGIFSHCTRQNLESRGYHAL